MRHASHDCGTLTSTGEQQVDETARSLAEWVTLTDRRIGHIWHSNRFIASNPRVPPRSLADECGATAARLRLNLADDLERFGYPTDELPEPEPKLLDLPPTYRRERHRPAEEGTVAERDSNIDAAATSIDRSLTACPDDVAVLVTNEPQVGWLLDALARAPMSLAHGEMVGLERSSDRTRWRNARRYRVRWAITPTRKDDPELMAALLGKVESKMKTAGAFSGLLVAVLTFVLTGLVKREVPLAFATVVSLGLLLASAWLFFATLIFYDSLTMPPRFWAHRRPRREPRWLLERPPSSSLRIIHQNMVRTWSRMFVPAVVCLGLAVLPLVTLINSTDPVEPSGAPPPSAPSLLSDADWGRVGAWLGPLLGLVVLLGLWTYWFRPRVGSDD